MNFQAFYITTQDAYGEPIEPNSWEGHISKNTPIALTYFDEYGMEFHDGNNIFRLTKPCPITPASSCPHCSKIIETSTLSNHLENDTNCINIRK